MPSTYSPLLRLELIGAGEQSGLWGETTNKNIGGLLEQAIAGVTTVSLSGGAGNYTLTTEDGAPDQARSAVLKFIGNPSGAKNIIIPTQTKLYVVRNDCGQTIYVKTAGQVDDGVRLLNGEATLVFCDGSIAIAGIATEDVGTLTVSGGGTGSTTFATAGFIKSPSGGTSPLVSVATVNLSTEVSGTLSVARGGTGAGSFTAGRILIGNGTGQFAVLAGSSTGQVATWDNTAGQWVAASPTVGITAVSANAPITASTVGTTATIGLVSGSQNGQVLQWNGSTWSAQLLPTGGTVTSVSGTGGYGGLTLSGTVTSSGNITLGGTPTGTWPITSTDSQRLGGSLPSAYLGANATATDSFRLGGQLPTYYAAASALSSYVVLSTAYDNPSFVNTLSGNKITSGQVYDSARLGGTAAANFPTLGGTNAFTGLNTFTNGNIRSPAYNFTATTSIFNNGDANIQFAVLTGVRMTLDVNGNLNIQGTLTQGSDPRLKDNIQDYTRGLDTLQNIRVRSWTYNGKGGTQKGRKAIGVVATEIESVMPEMVTEVEAKLNPDDNTTTKIKNVDALQMTWLLVKSVQELKAEVDALKAQLQGA